MAPRAFHPELYIGVPAELRHIPNLLTVDCPDEMAVYSMTAQDEINLKIPDALFNGIAIVNLIEGCVPNIKNAWLLPLSGLHQILSAIRIASAGPAVTLSIKCPKCEEENDYDVNLSAIIDSLSTIEIPESLILKHNDINFVLEFTSINYRDLTDYHIGVFKNQKIMSQLAQLDEEDPAANNSLIESVNESNIFWVVHNIKRIVIKDDTVSDREHITSFIRDIDKSLSDQIKDHIAKYTSKLIPNLEFDCTSCQYRFNTEFSLDHANLFRSNLLSKDGQEITDYIDTMEKEIGAIKKDLLRSVWFMRGGVTYTEILRMSVKERRVINKIVEDNIKTTKESGLPFF